MKNRIIYFSSIALALILLFVGYTIVKDGYDIDYSGSSGEYLRATVNEITSVDVEQPNENNPGYTVTTYNMKLKVNGGSLDGHMINATQVIDTSIPQNPNPVKVGDKIITYDSASAIHKAAGNEIFAKIRSLIDQHVDPETASAVYLYDAVITEGDRSGEKLQVRQFVSTGEQSSPLSADTEVTVRKNVSGSVSGEVLTGVIDEILKVEEQSTYKMYTFSATITEGSAAGTSVELTRVVDKNTVFPAAGSSVFVTANNDGTYSYAEGSYVISDLRYEYFSAIVTEVGTPATEDGQVVVKFSAQATDGKYKGETFDLEQTVPSSGESVSLISDKVNVGDVVNIKDQVGAKSTAVSFADKQNWVFAEHVRSDATIILAVLFCIAIVVFGRAKGLKTLVTLILTIASVFFVLIPAIIGGRNIYFWTIAVCIYITAMTLVIVNGVSFMSLVGGIGCMGGVLVAAMITLIMDRILNLTGYTDECTIYIKGINNGVIDLKAIVFAGILIGAIGAVMDVAVNIAASVHEVAAKIKKPTFKELYRSGITISRDIIGTMSNTLILAYIGSSLCSVLLIIYNNGFSMLNLFNKENIIVELLKILVGSFGILSALPITSVISAAFYSKREKFVKDTAADDADEYSEMLENFNQKK